MKNRLFATAVSLAFIAACSTTNPEESGEKGSIRISFSKDYALLTKTSMKTLPDTNDFILRITDASGRRIYDGKFGASPESVITDPGSYTVEAISEEFNEPGFDSPQYGDSRVISVLAGKTTSVIMDCTQLNAGIRLKTSPDFLTVYPSGVLYLKSSDGRLMYSYSEKRVAFFNPGPVTLLLNDGGVEKPLFTRNLYSREILTVTLDTGTSASTKGGVHIQVDTSRNWTSANFTIGQGESGDETGNAYSVSQAKSHIGESDKWVYGYIVGGDLSSSRCSFAPPFVSRTNIAIAAKSSCQDKEQCLSVKLSQGDIRDALNLVDHPENFGRQIFIKGDIVSSYYGIPGLQGISEYKWK